MTPASLAALTLIFFATSLVTVVTGSTTLITIPVLMQFGIEPRTAVATNMLALTLLSLGGVLPFAGTRAIDRSRTTRLTLLTLAGSAAGAALLFAVPSKWMTLIIPCAMIVVLTVFLTDPATDQAKRPSPSPVRDRSGYIAMALLSVYGGFLSGGYATLVTAAGVLFFRYPLLRAIAMSKVLNTASSLIAVAIFARFGIVNWRLGILLSAAAFAGGFMGTHWARKMPTALLRRFFLLAVAALALKTMIFDVPWKDLTNI